MSDIANHDEALRCVDVGRRALAAGDAARAEKFAAKAVRLYRCRETEGFASEVADVISGASARGGPAGASAGDQSQQHHHRGGHSNGARASPDGGGGFGDGVEGLRRRGGGGGGGGSDGGGGAAAVDPSVTHEQREMVVRILRSKDYYEILAVSRTADDEEIKRAYRKLALKLHPDKNKAPKAEDAFKAVSRAFSCLSDADARAHYDRVGAEPGARAAAAGAYRGGGGGGGAYRGGPFGPMGGTYYAGDDIDPEEIFNMFFGAGAFGHQRVFRTHFGAPPRRAGPGGGARASQAEQQRGAMLGLIQLLPVLLLVLMTLFGGSQEPAYSLTRNNKYAHEMATARLEVPFWVKSAADFEGRHGAPGTHARTVLDRQVESEHYERVHMQCQQERMTQHRMATWGSRERAKAMATPGCDQLGSLNERLGIGRGAQGRVPIY